MRCMGEGIRHRYARNCSCQLWELFVQAADFEIRLASLHRFVSPLSSPQRFEGFPSPFWLAPLLLNMHIGTLHVNTTVFLTLRTKKHYVAVVVALVADQSNDSLDAS